MMRPRRAMVVGALASAGLYLYLRPEHPLPPLAKRELRFAMLSAHKGDHETAGQHYDRAVARTLADAGDASWQAASVLSTAGIYFSENGEPLRAGPLLTKGWILLLQQGRTSQALAVAQALGHSLIEMGEDTEAEKMLNAALRLVKEHGKADAQVRRSEGAIREQLGSILLGGHRCALDDLDKFC